VDLVEVSFPGLLSPSPDSSLQADLEFSELLVWLLLSHMDPCFFWSFWSAAVYLVGVSFPGRLSPPFDSSLPGGLVPFVLAHDPVGYFLSFSHLVLPPRFAYLFFILFSKPTPALFSFGFICRSSRYWDYRVG
jgi:hypothetical protein